MVEGEEYSVSVLCQSKHRGKRKDTHRGTRNELSFMMANETGDDTRDDPLLNVSISSNELKLKHSRFLLADDGFHAGK